MTETATTKHRAFREDEHVKWVSIGQKVWTRWKGATGVLCTVVVAAGDMAEVESKRHDIRVWRSIYELYPEERPLA